MARIDSRRLAWVLLACMCFEGCGGEASDRAEVAGSVTFNGTALPLGSIAFRPLDGAGPTAGAEIIDGQFLVSAEKGVLPGGYRVEIAAMRKTGRVVQDPVYGKIDVEEQYLPAKYNIQSKLIVEIPSESSDALTFELTSE